MYLCWKQYTKNNGKKYAICKKSEGVMEMKQKKHRENIKNRFKTCKNDGNKK